MNQTTIVQNLDATQKPWITPSAAYVHVPFCAAKCGYCDFNSFAGMMGLAKPYVDALCTQIALASAENPGNKLETIFFGGGTPSILPAEELIRILEALKAAFGLATDAEITFEANPESATLRKLTQLRSAGFNRISLGAQSFDDQMLERLGRVHDHRKFLEAFDNARQSGFTNVSFDLMFALPGQTLEDLKSTLEEAVSLDAEHISCYGLTIEEDTEFFTMFQKNILDIPAESTQIEMYYTVIRTMKSAGLEQYEISNYAKPGRRCRHNEVYWRNEAYWGFGAGAVQFVNNRRTKWEISPSEYTEQIQQSGSPEVAESEALSTLEQMGETAMLALRTSDGLDLKYLSDRFGMDAESEFYKEINHFAATGLLEYKDGRVRLTYDGLALANEVMIEFLR